MGKLNKKNLEKIGEIGRLFQTAGSYLSEFDAGLIGLPTLEKKLGAVLDKMKLVIEE